MQITILAIAREEHMVKIKEYRVSKRGIRGLAISLPKVWVDDSQLTPGDTVEFYRDEHDRLILIPKKNDPNQVA